MQGGSRNRKYGPENCIGKIIRASKFFSVEPYMLHLAQQGFNEILLIPRQASNGNLPRLLGVSAVAGDLRCADPWL